MPLYTNISAPDSTSVVNMSDFYGTHGSLWGEDGSLHLTVPSMNSLNQTESAVLGFLKGSLFSLFYSVADCSNESVFNFTVNSSTVPLSQFFFQLVIYWYSEQTS
jgi:hypothetical protein